MGVRVRRYHCESASSIISKLESLTEGRSGRGENYLSWPLQPTEHLRRINTISNEGKGAASTLELEKTQENSHNRYGVQSTSLSLLCAFPFIYMPFNSPVWRLAYRMPGRQARRKLLRPQIPSPSPIHQPDTRAPVQMFLTRNEAIQRRDDQIRRIMRREVDEVVEEVVRARREIWGGLSGRKSSSHDQHRDTPSIPLLQNQDIHQGRSLDDSRLQD